MTSGQHKKSIWNATAALPPLLLALFALMEPPKFLGTGIGLRVTTDLQPGANESTVTFSMQTGKETARVRFELDQTLTPSTADRITAELTNGTRLVARLDPDDPSWVDVFRKAPDSDGAGAIRAPFAWTTGDELIVRVPRSLGAPREIQNWYIHTDNGTVSKASQARRRFYRWVAVPLLFLSLLALFIINRDGKVDELSTERIIWLIIADIGNDDHPFAKDQQQLLQQLMKGEHVEDALSAIGRDPNTLSSKQLFLQARRRFADRLEARIRRLRAFQLQVSDTDSAPKQ